MLTFRYLVGLCIALPLLTGCGTGTSSDAPADAAADSATDGRNNDDARPKDDQASSAAPRGAVSVKGNRGSGGETATHGSEQEDQAAADSAEPKWKAEDEPLRKGASPEEAARVIDFRKFPTMEGAEPLTGGRIANITTVVTADVQKAFDFHRKKLLEMGFRELEGSKVEYGSGSGTYFRDGFLVTLSVFPAGGTDAQGKVNVRLSNHGNVNTHKLPVPDGVEVFYGGPTNASYITDASVEESMRSLTSLLTAQGWKPYGEVQGSIYFKQNGVKLLARVISAPAQGGRTVISFGTEQLSADLPAPDGADGLQYSDSTKDLRFDYAGTFEQLDSFYRNELAESGWQATTENPVEIGFKKHVIFRNPAKDMLELAMWEFEGQTRASVVHKTAEEVAELERRMREETERQAAARNAPKSKPPLAIAVPADAQNLKVTEGELKFNVGGGKARAGAEAIAKSLTDAGWETVQSSLEAMAGLILLTDESRTLTINYVDVGVLPAEVTVSSSEFELQKAP